MANNDRVADLYYRRIYSTEAQDACRERVHWLCEHAEGARVLDIGCSQGIVSIILAREGRTVVGLDIEAPVIAAAQQALKEESAQVQERVTFTVGDAFTADFEPASFDTVILGEVLEHLASPGQLLARVRRWLRPGGRVVLSVPHGYEPFHDHKRTFYLLRLVELLAPHFTLTEVAPVYAKYLCAVAVRPPDGEAPSRPAPDRLLGWAALAEGALETLQQSAHQEKTALQAEHRKVTERGAEYRESIAKLKHAGDELRAQIRAVKAEKESSQQRAQAAQKNLEERIGQRAQERDEARQQLAELRRQLSEVQRQSQDSARRERELTKQIGKLESALASLQQQAEQERESARARAERVEAARQQAEELRKDVQQQLQATRTKLQRVQELHTGEKQLRRQSQAAADRFRSDLGHYKAELAEREQGVRYRLGDAFVRAARPSLDTLKLPFRIVSLFFEGLRRRRARRRAARAGGAAGPAGPVFAKPVADADASGHTSKVEGDGERPRTPTGTGRERDARKESRFTPTTQIDGPADAGLQGIATLTQPFASAPPELRRRDDLRICAVCDEFSWRAWQFEAEVYTCTPKTWREVLEERRPDLLLVESAWAGLDNSWYFQLRDLGQRGEVIKYYAVPDMVAWCRERGIPTVFYNKEDPPNFDVFVEAAKQFDHVFTSDANCIPDYRKHVKHERVYALPFAAQPRVHNPIMTGTRTGAVCFAGTWYAHRHFARHDDAEKILRPALDYDLHIFDRMANSGNPNYRWPDAYLSAVRGALPYSQMLAAYKRYRVFLNVNSVKNSPTMFARRVFELLACGTPVVSSYSEGIEELFGTDLVLMSNDEDTTRQLLERVLGDDEYRERLALRGQRRVLSEHTYTHRLQTMLDTIGLERPVVGRPVLTMIAFVEDAGQLAAAWENFSRQTYANKRLVLCARRPAALANADSITGGGECVRIIAAEDALPGRLLRDALQACEEGFIGALNPADFYGPDYLTDYANATLFVTEPAIGKASFYQAESGAPASVANSASEYRVLSHVHPWTLCLSLTRAEQAAGRLSSAQTPAEWWNRLMRQLDRIYAADRFNYVRQLDTRGTGDEPAGQTTPFMANAKAELESALA